MNFFGEESKFAKDGNSWSLLSVGEDLPLNSLQDKIGEKKGNRDSPSAQMKLLNLWPLWCWRLLEKPDSSGQLSPPDLQFKRSSQVN